MCVFQKTSLLAGMEKNALQNFSEFHQNITALQSLLKESSIDLSSGCLRKSLHPVGHRRRQTSQFLARRFKSPFPSSSLSLYPTAHVRPVLLLCWTTAYSTQPEASEMAFPPISERAAPCNWLAEGEKLWLWKQKSSSSKDMQKCWVLIYFYPFKYYLILDCCWVKKKSLKEIFSTWKNYRHCQLRHIFVCCYKRLLSCYYSFQEILLNNGEAVVCQGHVEKHTISDRTETDGRNARWKTSIFYDTDPGLEFLWWIAPRSLEQLWACVFQEKAFGTLQETMELRTELETFKSWCVSLQAEDQPRKSQ